MVVLHVVARTDRGLHGEDLLRNLQVLPFNPPTLLFLLEQAQRLGRGQHLTLLGRPHRGLVVCLDHGVGLNLLGSRSCFYCLLTDLIQLCCRVGGQVLARVDANHLQVPLFLRIPSRDTPLAKTDLNKPLEEVVVVAFYHLLRLFGSKVSGFGLV